MYEHMHAPANQQFVPESEVHKNKHEWRLKKPDAWIQSVVTNARYRLACHEIGEPPFRDVFEEERQRKHDEYWRMFGSMELEILGLTIRGRMNDHPGGTAW